MAERISFTRPAAERIARAVRVVENAQPSGQPLRARMIAEARKPKAFRVCTFTGSWEINAEKTVTFKYQTTTPNTASALNLFFPVRNTATSARDCAIAKEGTAWYLIDAGLRTATAIFATSTQRTAVLTDVTLSASLNTSACTISIGKTLVTASRIFVTGTATGTYLMLE